MKTILFASALLIAAAAHADVAYTSFGPGNSFSTSVGYNIGSPTSSNGYQSGAMQLTSLTTGTLLSVTVPITYRSGSGSVFVGFYADSGNDVGAQLASWTLTATGQNVVTLNAPAGVPLATGAKYWVGMIAQGNTHVLWNNTSPSVNGPYAVNYDTQNGAVSGQVFALRVETQPVPEPATFAALGLGALGLLRRRRKA